MPVKHLLTGLAALVLVGLAACGSLAHPPSSPAGRLAEKLGKPPRLLIGLGTGSSTEDIRAQGLRPDLYDRYLNGVGGTDGAGGKDWTEWVGPGGQYVTEVTKMAEDMGAVPMFTLYQMAARGDGNLSGLKDPEFMKGYWDNVRLLFRRLGAYGKPAVVSFEPDFWGYIQQQSKAPDPEHTFAHVAIAAECAALPDDVTGFAGCLMALARTYAPKAVVGFPPSEWGDNDLARVIAFMRAIGAGKADFITMQTLDGDVGCYEAAFGRCKRPGILYWDETNRTHPNFDDHFALARAYRDGIGGLPLLWWQTPLGVPSDKPGGTEQRFRDNRAHYFLTHPKEVVAAGGVGIVFSNGDDVTGIATDDGQYQRLSTQYLAHPAPLR